MSKFYNILEVPQRSEEWKKTRLKYITASEVPTLFGHYGSDKTNTPLKLAFQKLYQIEFPTNPNNEYIFEKGHLAEEEIRKWVHKNTDLQMNPLVVVSKIVPNLLASLDGFDSRQNAVIEAKYIGAKRRETLCEDGCLPESHLLQMQAL